jgi:predicted nuclease of predicted toxin-antitoxin system
MKLLFDQNLGLKLCQAVADLFSSSSKVCFLGLADALRLRSLESKMSLWPSMLGEL